MPLNSTRGAGSAKGFGFTSAGVKPVDFDYLVVAGGGAGYGTLAGGAGGGGMRSSFPGGTKVTIRSKITTITVGAGGSAINSPTVPSGPTLAACHGNDSSIGTDIVSAGGGYWNSSFYDPGTPNTNPVNATQRNGGSGCGQTHQSQTNTGLGNTPPTSPAQGYPGGPGGGSFGASGGGGAGGAGNNGDQANPSSNSGPGGSSAPNSISGSATDYAGGGGGGSYGGAAGGGGGGGGGAGGPAPAAGQAGSANTGGGGGGPGVASGIGVSGGSGIIYMRIPAANAPVTLAVAPGTNTLTTLSPSGDKLATFTVTGTLTI
jgi:hypothetical protein